MATTTTWTRTPKRLLLLLRPILILILTGMWHSLTSVPLPTLILPALIAIVIVIRMPMNYYCYCWVRRSVVRLGKS